MVITSDVLEHIPLPYQAHREIFRVLKRGGKHVFTVPFHQTRYFDEILAQPGNNDEPILLKQPVYHHDPIRPDGILVYTIFSLEMLLRLREIGFQTSMYRLYHPLLGILGANGLVFEAIKEQ
jgi:ubiquinone/menaquinone biosynthesis C-methylase UbiE